MENQKVILDDPKNRAILDKIKQSVSQIIQDPIFKYKFDEGIDQDKLLRQHNLNIDVIIRKYCSDRTITESINQTEWPDEFVLLMLTKSGYEFNSIYDFKSIDKDVSFDKDMRILNLSIIPTLQEKMVRIVIDTDIKPDYTCNEEVVECE